VTPSPEPAHAPGVADRRAQLLHTALDMSAPPDNVAAALAGDTDEALMLAYAAGRAAAFDTLYARHRGGVYRYLLRHCSNAGTADELFQDVWMNAIRARDRYVPTAKFTTWLYTLAHNRLVDHWRARGQAKFASIDDDGDEATRAAVEALPGSRREEPEARMATRQLRDQLHAALATLPAVQRDAFLLQQEGGLSLAEIAELTGVGMETVKSRLRYAVAKLRGELAMLRAAPREEPR
jgi:RNA polymerase sigma-70 factor (ECF subfamily)